MIDENEAMRVASFVIEHMGPDEVKEHAVLTKEERALARKEALQSEISKPHPDAGKRPRTPPRSERARPVYVGEDTPNIKDMTPQQLQEHALQALVEQVSQGNVAASKELLAFTESTYISANHDLEEMSASELLAELDRLRDELQYIVNRETVGI